MGICSSKQATKGTPGASPTPPADPQQAPGAAAAEAESLSTAAAADDTTQEYPRTPVSPSQPADGEGDQEAHTYNSSEKPSRSAMRPSMDGKSPGQYSRKSSSGLSSVGFNVNVDAPDAENHEALEGGNSISLKKIVDMFYAKVLVDADLAPFFENIDMQKLKNHQVRFMGLAFGGKDLVFEEDPNLNLRKVHYRLIKDKGLSLVHWEKFVALFDKTLSQLERDIPEAARTDAMRSIRATKHFFVPIGQETEFTNASIAALPTEEQVTGAAAAAAAGEIQHQQ